MKLHINERLNKMLKIGICDDEIIFRNHLLQIIKQYLDENKMVAELLEYNDGSELVKNNNHIDILFLDIEMKTMSGIEVKETFIKNREDTIIIFISSHSEYTREMIGRNVYYFLEKPVKKENVYKVFNNVISLINRNTKIELEEAGNIYILDYKKIKYIIAKDKYTRVYLEDEKYLFRKPIKYWLQVLPEELFCEINRSVIVSFSHFVKKADGVLLDNGESVKFSRKRKTEIMEKYKNYLRQL
jgi:DNA-binding LytR/AlgR family response regulator